MTTTSENNQKMNLFRVRKVGYLLSFLGLIAGALAVDQTWASLWSVPPISISLDWLLIEGMASALFCTLGFLLLVVTTNQGEEQEQRGAGRFDSHAEN